MFKLKRVKLPLLVAAMASSLTSWADPFEVDGIYYSVTSASTVEVAWSGAARYSGDVNIPEMITYKDQSYDVTAIGGSAFGYATEMTSVTIPQGVTEIKDGAFEGCSKLTDVMLPLSVKTIGSEAFSECSSLVSVTIQEGVTEIPSKCFYDCSQLQYVSIPEGVTEIQAEAFYACEQLKTITLPSTLTTIYDRAFWACGRLRSIIVKATTPPECSRSTTFVFDKSATTITAPVESVPAYVKAPVWNEFTHWGGVAISNGLFYRVNGNNADIYYVDSSVTEPSIMTEVAIDGKDYALKYINSRAFQGNNNITKVSIPDGVEELYSGAFAGCSNLTSVTLPSAMREVGSNAFEGCSALKSIVLPKDITSIHRSCFYFCTELQSIDIPEGVTNIYDYAFYGCTKLESAALPSTLTEISRYAFWNCTSLSSIVVNAVTPPTCADTSEFYNLEATVTVPHSSISAYLQAEMWEHFKNYSGSVTIDGITYVESDNGADICYVNPWLFNANILSSVTIDGKEYALTHINGTAFQNMVVLISVVVPEGVTSISGGAFKNCGFLSSVTLPSTLTSIGASAFNGCNKISSIVVNATTPPACESGAFDFDKTAATVTAPFASIPAYIAADGWTDFDNYSGVAIVDGIVYRPAGKEADIYCVKPSVTEANIQSSVTIDDTQYSLTAINGTAFSGNSAITKVVIPEGVTDVRTEAFKDCVNLASVTLPSTLENLGVFSFRNCSALTEVAIPSKVEKVPYFCFDSCTGLSSVLLPEGLATLDYGAFYRCSSLTAVTLPSTLTSLGNQAFSDSGLKEIVIPDGVEKVGDGCFEGCGSLSAVTFPEGLTAIGDEALRGCTSLTAVNLPSALQSIGDMTFYRCEALNAITCEALVPPTVAGRTFYEIDKDVCVLTVPKASRGAYLGDSQWSQFMTGTDNVVVGIEGQGRVAYADNKAVVFDAANICAKTNSTLTFNIEPAEGYELQSATYADDDVTAQIAGGVFTTPTVSADTDFNIVFAAKDYFVVNDIAAEAGDNVVMPIELVNPDAVSAVDVQIVLPEGVTVALDDDGKLMVEHDASRLVDQTLDATIDGQKLTIITQAGGHSYIGTAGTLINVTLAVDANLHHGSYDISLNGAKLLMATGVTANSPAAKCVLTVSNASGVTDAEARTYKAYGGKGQLTILGAEGMTADVVAADGRIAATVECSSSKERIALVKGVYLVRVNGNGNVTKVVVY